MFKTASDRQHYQRREGSHSTKGSRRGIVWWGGSRLEELALPLDVQRQMVQLRKIWTRLAAAHKMARNAEPKDVELIRRCYMLMRQLRKNAKATARKHTVLH